MSVLERIRLLWCVAAILSPAAWATETVNVTNVQTVTAGMKTGVILKIRGSGAKCTYLGNLAKRYPEKADSPWVLRADRRNCRKTEKGDLVMTDVMGIVLLESLPVPAGTALTLYERPGR